MNRYQYNNIQTEFQPYVYFLRHIPSQMWYIGSKYSKDAHPSNFLKTYFTSSKTIQSIIKTEGISVFEFKILKVFDTASQALEYEHRILTKLHAVTNPYSINIDVRLSKDTPIHVRVKCIRISNQLTNTCITWPYNKPIPDGWMKGNVNGHGDSNVKKRLWFHQPSTGQVVHSPICPDGFIPGRGPKYVGNSNALKSRKGKWYTNGKESVCIYPDQVPPGGFFPGRTKSDRERENNKIANTKRKGCKWITDGKSSKQWFEELPPEGWEFGLTRTNPS